MTASVAAQRFLLPFAHLNLSRNPFGGLTARERVRLAIVDLEVACAAIREGGAERQVVFSGTWSAGSRHVYPFAFVTPAGPYTCHGREVNVDWYVQADADIPWRLDPSAQQDFVLRPDAAPIGDDRGHQRVARGRGGGGRPQRDEQHDLQARDP